MSQLGLRVFHPDGEVSTGPMPVLPARRLDPARITLSDFFGQHAWPRIFLPRNRSTRTRADYLGSLGHWERIWRCPSLLQITPEMCAAFVCRLRDLPGRKGRPMSENTVFKHWVNIQRLLDLTGPADRENPDRAGILDDPPWIGRLRRQQPAPKSPMELHAIWRWLDALPRAARSCPRNAAYDPAAWWRALILTAYNTGARPGTYFRIRWEWLSGHVLRVPPGEAIKGTAGRLLYLNSAALEALAPLRRPAGLVLGWSDWPKAETTLKKHRYRQLAAVGLPPADLYALRRSFATQAAMINPLAAQIQMGHVGAGMSMMAAHYIDHESFLASALERLPQPEKPVQGKLF